MTLPLATPGIIIKDFLNDTIKWIGKIRHRRNHETDDENYINPVVRIGWTYLQGDNSGSITIPVTYGITFNDYPILFASVLGRRLVSGGAPTGIEDIISGILGYVSLNIHSIIKTQGSVTLYKEDPLTFTDDSYYAIAWIAIGKKD
jgi:hypothetical protein